MVNDLSSIDHLQKLATTSKQYTDSLALKIIDSTRNDLAYISNPNLLINYDFRVPINQRGYKVYSLIGYTIDMWMLNSSDLTLRVEEGYIRISKTIRDSNPSFIPRIEFDSLLFGRVCTLSLIYRSNMSDARMWANPTGADSSNKIIPKSEDWNMASVTFTVDDSHYKYSPFMIQFPSSIQDPDNFFDIMVIKFELGNKQTLARQENDKWVLIDPPPNPEVELSKCQRYQNNLVFGMQTDYCLIGQGITTNNTSASIIYTAPPMAKLPTIVYDGELKLAFNSMWNDSNNQYVTKIEISNSSDSWVKRFGVEVQSGSISANIPVFLYYHRRGQTDDRPNTGLFMLDANL